MNSLPHPLPSASRRFFLRDCGYGLGKIALAGLLGKAAAANVMAAEGLSPPDAAGKQMLAPKKPPLPAKAEAVIHLFMAGAPSQLDLFDYKPELAKLEGKPLPPSVIGGQRYAFIRPDAAVMGPRFSFQKYGKSGAELSTVLPHLAKVVDEICIVHSMRTDQFNHAPAQLLMNTGFGQPGRPSLGSWAIYGLGAHAENLPAFVVMSTGSGISGGSALWSSGFLPTSYSGVRLRNSGDPILNVASAPGFDRRLERDTLDVLGELNRRQLGAVGDPEIATRIDAYEMAFRLQTSAPELMDLKSETKNTIEMYGCDPQKPSFARSCLLARRMVERGVRFINIFHEGWDAHSDVTGNSRNNCKATDQASAALVADLKQRGLLDKTLVIWGGEFGRTPMIESNAALGRSQGRDHHPQAFTVWLAGGGFKSGLTYGSTDELGFHVVDSPVHVYDLQATILQSLGFDHERLTFHHAGRDFRLTDVHGKVVKDLLA